MTDIKDIEILYQQIVYEYENNQSIAAAYAGRSEQSARHFRAGSPLIQSTLAGVLSTVANM